MNAVPCAIKGGPQQRIHPGRHAGETHATLVAHLGDRGDQHSRLADQESAGFETQFDARQPLAQFRESRLQSGQVEARSARPVGYAEPASQVDPGELRKARQDRDQRTPGVEPDGGIEDAASDVRVQSDDMGSHGTHGFVEPCKFADRKTELRLGARGAHFLVVARAAPRIESHADRSISKLRGIRSQRLGAVDDDLGAGFECDGVLGRRTEVRSEQQRHAVPDDLPCAQHLRRRNALDSETGAGERAQYLGVVIGFHRVVEAIDPGQPALQRSSLVANGRQVIDETRRAVGDAIEQRLPLRTPPGRWRRFRRGQAPGQQFPGRTEARTAALGREEMSVQSYDERARILFIDDEGEVEIFRRVAHQVNRLLLERSHRRTQFVQRGSDAPPDDRDDRAGVDDPDFTDGLQPLE